jgi:hypothetical protein
VVDEGRVGQIADALLHTADENQVGRGVADVEPAVRQRIKTHSRGSVNLSKDIRFSSPN